MTSRYLKYIISAFIFIFILDGCNMYKPYTRPEIDTVGLYRDTISEMDNLISDTANMGNLPWWEVFQDPYLQNLVEQGLEYNFDLRIALLRIEEYRAQFTASKLAFLPSLSAAPSGTISSYDFGKASKTYQLPLATSWEIDIFGRLLNSKRAALAALLQSEAYQQAVQTQIIASIAKAYYTLLMLDKQLYISEETLDKWEESVETMKALKLAGIVNETAVVQGEANLYQVAAGIPDIKIQIRETENALSLLIGEPAQTILRGEFDDVQLPDTFSAGLPIQLLNNRPDVREAEMALALAYSNTNIARSAFYPQLTISGNGGWSNSAGNAVINPGKFIASATAGLIQPIFNRGLNRANLRVAIAQQQEALLSFQKTILIAGNEVSNALYQYKSANEKSIYRKQQIQALELSVNYTQQLLRLSSSTYLEVLTAQQSLLSAQLSEVSDQFQKVQAIINLYQALGGGRE